MDRKPVQSSNIASVGYEESTETLEVEFSDGNVYQYQGVPKHIYEQLVSAPSVGQFFHFNIRNSFPYMRIG